MSDVPYSNTKKQTPEASRPRGFVIKSLAVTYSGMPAGHTTIGAERFHFRVRNGIGWFPLAIAARQPFETHAVRCHHRTAFASNPEILRYHDLVAAASEEFSVLTLVAFTPWR